MAYDVRVETFSALMDKQLQELIWGIFKQRLSNTKNRN